MINIYLFSKDVNQRFGEYGSPSAQVETQWERLTGFCEFLLTSTHKLHKEYAPTDNEHCEYITRLLTPEFLFFTKEPLTQNEFDQLCLRLQAVAKQLDENVHVLLSSFAVLAQGLLCNACIYVVGGQTTQQSIHVFCKYTPVMLERGFYPNRDHFACKRAEDVTQYSTPEAFTLPSTDCIFTVKTKLGNKYTQIVSICADGTLESGFKNLKLLLKQYLDKNEKIPLYNDHVCTANSIDNNDKAIFGLFPHAVINVVREDSKRKNLCSLTPPLKAIVIDGYTIQRSSNVEIRSEFGPSVGMTVKPAQSLERNWRSFGNEILLSIYFKSKQAPIEPWFATYLKEFFDQLKTKLSKVNEVILCGPPGVGKTSVINYYSAIHKDPVCWIDTRNKETLEKSVEQLAEMWEIPLCGTVSKEVISTRGILSSLYSYFITLKVKTVFVLDNIPGIREISQSNLFDCLPKESEGIIKFLLLSDKDFIKNTIKNKQETIFLPALNDKASVQFLCEELSRLAVCYTMLNINQLAYWCQGNLSYLQHAVHTIKERSYTIEQYIQCLEYDPQTLFSDVSNKFALSRILDRMIAPLIPSYQEVKKEHALALKILNMIAYFGIKETFSLKLLTLIFSHICSNIETLGGAGKILTNRYFFIKENDSCFSINRIAVAMVRHRLLQRGEEKETLEAADHLLKNMTNKTNDSIACARSVEKYLSKYNVSQQRGSFFIPITSTSGTGSFDSSDLNLKK